MRRTKWKASYLCSNSSSEEKRETTAAYDLLQFFAGKKKNKIKKIRTTVAVASLEKQVFDAWKKKKRKKNKNTVGFIFTMGEAAYDTGFSGVEPGSIWILRLDIVGIHTYMYGIRFLHTKYWKTLSPFLYDARLWSTYNASVALFLSQGPSCISTIVTKILITYLIKTKNSRTFPLTPGKKRETIRRPKGWARLEYSGEQRGKRTTRLRLRLRHVKTKLRRRPRPGRGEEAGVKRKKNKKIEKIEKIACCAF